jgi:hypothetical protein
VLFIHTIGKPHPSGFSETAAGNAEDKVLFKVVHKGPVITGPGFSRRNLAEKIKSPLRLNIAYARPVEGFL